MNSIHNIKSQIGQELLSAKTNKGKPLTRGHIVERAVGYNAFSPRICLKMSSYKKIFKCVAVHIVCISKHVTISNVPTVEYSIVRNKTVL